MELTLALSLINVFVIPLAGAVAYMLWNKIAGIEKEQLDQADRIWAELKTVNAEMDHIRLNYLDRFDDIKDIINLHHLQSMEKITILETLLKQHLKTGDR